MHKILVWELIIVVGASYRPLVLFKKYWKVMNLFTWMNKQSTISKGHLYFLNDLKKHGECTEKKHEWTKKTVHKKYGGLIFKGPPTGYINVTCPIGKLPLSVIKLHFEVCSYAGEKCSCTSYVSLFKLVQYSLKEI